MLTFSNNVLQIIIKHNQYRFMISQASLTKILPKLTFQTTKGVNGIIGVIGGSIEYTGAPYYAAMAALKMGADLVHVFCSKEAAGPIKTYSPELIVHPVFNYDSQTVQKSDKNQIEQMTSKWINYFKSKFDRINCWVIGPGLGRHECLSLFFRKFIESLPINSYLVIDADGLFFLCKHPDLLLILEKIHCIMTPNLRQFTHLNKILNINVKMIQQSKIRQQQLKDESEAIASRIQVSQQCKWSIIIKGEKDIIFHKGKHVSLVLTRGGMKRCGGIGDVLAGCLASCYFWDTQQGPILACHAVKLAARQAFKHHGRSLTGLGVLQQIQGIVHKLE